MTGSTSNSADSDKRAWNLCDFVRSGIHPEGKRAIFYGGIQDTD